LRISAKADYAIQAAAELATYPSGQLIKGVELARAQRIPLQFLENILRAMKAAEIVTTQRGTDGGYGLARPADQITLADVLDAVEGPLAGVRCTSLQHLDYQGAAAPLRDVWMAMWANMRAVLGSVTLADLAAGELPPSVVRMITDHGAPLRT
jgi:Rrf2 family protein